jgi:hypothetical protein
MYHTSSKRKPILQRLWLVAEFCDPPEVHPCGRAPPEATALLRPWRGNYVLEEKIPRAGASDQPALVEEGHCNEILHPGAYQQASNHKTDLRNLTIELDANYSIDKVAAQLAIAHLLD